MLFVGLHQFKEGEPKTGGQLDHKSFLKNIKRQFTSTPPFALTVTLTTKDIREKRQDKDKTNKAQSRGKGKKVRNLPDEKVKNQLT